MAREGVRVRGYLFAVETILVGLVHDIAFPCDVYAVTVNFACVLVCADDLFEFFWFHLRGVRCQPVLRRSAAPLPSEGLESTMEAPQGP